MAKFRPENRLKSWLNSGDSIVRNFLNFHIREFFVFSAHLMSIFNAKEHYSYLDFALKWLQFFLCQLKLIFDQIKWHPK